MKTLVNLLGEHPSIVNILLGPVTVHYIFYRALGFTVSTLNLGYDELLRNCKLITYVSNILVHWD